MNKPAHNFDELIERIRIYYQTVWRRVIMETVQLLKNSPFTLVHLSAPTSNQLAGHSNHNIHMLEKDESTYLSESAIEKLMIDSGAGRHILTYLHTFLNTNNSSSSSTSGHAAAFNSVSELTIAIKAAHIATQRIKAEEEERGKAAVLAALLNPYRPFWRRQGATTTASAASGGSTATMSTALQPLPVVPENGVICMIRVAGSGLGVLRWLDQIEKMENTSEKKPRDFNQLFQLFIDHFMPDN